MAENWAGEEWSDGSGRGLPGDDGSSVWIDSGTASPSPGMSTERVRYVHIAWTHTNTNTRTP